MPETIRVNAGGSIQSAMVAAQAGDIIELEAGAHFVGPLSLPTKPGVVTLRSSGALPERRIAQADAPNLATISSGVGAAAITGNGSQNWTISGVRFNPNSGGFGDVISLQDALQITMDRILLVVPDGSQQKRGVLGNGRHLSLTRSHLEGIWREGQDSQAFNAYDGAGPYEIRDNYLEAASENVMFGGADSLAPDRVPADIFIEGNHFTKALRWQTPGTEWVVKNLLELKSAKRVRVQRNVFERCWPAGQDGTACMLTPVNQLQGAPWSGIEDVIFWENEFRDVARGFTIVGYGYEYKDAPGQGGSTRQTTGIVIRDNTIAVRERGFFVANEVGWLAIYRNKIPFTGEGVALSLEATAVWPKGEAQERPARYAVERFYWAENETSGYIHSPTALGEAALQAYTDSYSLDPLNVPSYEPSDQEDPTPDPQIDLLARLTAAEVAIDALWQRDVSLRAYLAQIPKNAKLIDVVRYLQRVPH